MYFCPPPPRRNTASGDAEKIDKVRSALGMHYQPDLHFAVGHMRRWDGAYPPLTNGTKAVSLMTALDVKGPRCVCARVNAACSIHLTMILCQVRAAHEGPSLRVLVLQVLLLSFCRASHNAQQEIYAGDGRGRRRTTFLSSGSVSLPSSKYI